MSVYAKFAVAAEELNEIVSSAEFMKDQAIAAEDDLPSGIDAMIKIHPPKAASKTQTVMANNASPVRKRAASVSVSAQPLALIRVFVDVEVQTVDAIPAGKWSLFALQYWPGAGKVQRF